MKSNGIKEKLKVFRGRLLLPLLLALCLGLFQPRTAFAQTCEDPGTATASVANEQIQLMNYINEFTTQESSFDWANLSTAFVLLSNAWLTFTDNMLQALNTFATDLDSAEQATGLKYMTMELHVSQIDQTYRLGQLQDAQIMTEEELRGENYNDESQKRYAPSSLACDIDTTGPGLNRAYQISRALNRTLALDDEPRRENAVSTWPSINDAGNWQAVQTTSYNGRGQDVNAAYQDYLAQYCDQTMGDPGCKNSGVMPGQHKDIGALLWGSKLTIDPTDQRNIKMVQDNLRYFIDPLAPDTISQTVIPMPGTKVAQAAQGRTGILERHAEMAYVNTIYNTLGAMLSERIGGSKVDVSVMRAAAGLPTNATNSGTLPNVGASYREVQEAMTRDRFNDPQYLMKMLSNPEQVLRERNTLSALRLQTMNDIYRRQEELLFMESAEFGRDLDGNIPHAETARMPFTGKAAP